MTIAPIGGLGTALDAVRTPTTPPPQAARAEKEPVKPVERHTRDAGAAPTSTPGADRTDASGGTSPTDPTERDKAVQREAPLVDNPGQAVQTSAYLQQLLAAQTFGAAVTATRPAQITPERLAAYVQFLEDQVSVRPVEPDTGGQPVDVKG